MLNLHRNSDILSFSQYQSLCEMLGRKSLSANEVAYVMKAIDQHLNARTQKVKTAEWVQP